jgi:hypothetical protein
MSLRVSSHELIHATTRTAAQYEHHVVVSGLLHIATACTIRTPADAQAFISGMCGIQDAAIAVSFLVVPDDE